ncbi:MAG TPA: C25 family peptidase propeptide domain-containing protein, partial [Ignavibacteriaceae bacterium]|nr:C25 family peptidase propeptide domain-containing protein [Ignavibacteriaceae bacterium]
MKIKLILPFQFFLFVIFIFPQQIKILESNDKFIKLEFNFDGEFQIRDTLYDGKIFQYISSKKEFYRNPGEPWLPVTNLSLGIPFNSTPSIRILTNEQSTISNKFIIPFPAEDPLFEKSDFDEMDYKIYGSNKYFPENKVSFDSDYIMRYARVIPLNVSPYQFNPVTRELNYSKRIVIQIDYNEKILSDFFPIKDGFTDDYLKTSVINFSQAVQWTGKKISILPNNPLDNYWYDPAKDFFKIYLKVKGVYRLTYDYLSSKGMPLYLGMPSSNFNIYNNGVTIPIDVVDGGDSTFDHGDYIEFVGYPPTPTPYSNMNIYNLSNIYWISYQENTTPHRY